MLEGKLVVKHEKLGNVDYQVKARDTFNDLKLHITAHGDGGYTLWNNRRILFDYVLNEETGDYFSPYVDEPGSDIRRLDIKKTNKYKSNITNKDLAIKISSLVRYMQINGKKNYNQKNMGDNFSSIREVDVYDSEGKVYIGTVKYRMGLITELFCENKFLRLELKSGELGLLDETIFKELKEKDKWGNKISPAPISIVGFKLDEEFLGFKYVPPVSKEVVQAFGMYETIEDVISAHPEKNTRWILDRDYHIVTDANLEEVIQMFMDHDGLIAFDTETSGLNINFKSRTNEADQLVGVVLSRKPGEGYYFPLQHKLFPNLCDGDHHYFMERYMRPILEGKRIICHNLKFDWKVAYIYDINVNVVYDTMLAVGVTKRYEEESFEMSLAALAKNIFGLDMFELSDFVMGGSFGDSDIAFWDLPYELVRQYAPADTDITISLYKFFEQEDLLNKYNAKRIFDMEITFAKAVAYSEFYGYHVDVDRIPDLRERIIGAMEECKAKMFEIAGKEFNPNSPQQLASIMYDELGIEMIGNKRSTSKEILKALNYKTDAEGNPKYPFVKYLKEYRDNESIYKNFLKRLHEFSTDDGYIFPDVLQLGTNTGRTSVKNPNYQSYNDTVKKYITPRPGFIHVDSDFAQIEYRVLASMAGQEQLMDAFNDPDLDYHSYQASRMFSVPYAAVTKQLRQQSKGVNFGLPYGMGDESLGAAIFGERSPENTIQARKLREKFFQGQEKIQNFFETARANGVRNGFTETDFGRRRYYHKGVFSVSEIRRQAGNHVIQGCLGGDTRIQTKEFGIVKIKDVVGARLNVWDGEKWTKGDITYSGKKQKCIIKFSGGQSIICSPNHKFLTKSSKGNSKFVECKDLRSKETSKNPHRVVINRNYEKSDFKFDSANGYKYLSDVHNANNHLLKDIGNSFDIGLFLGRLASDGSILQRENGGSSITQFISEHEYNILPKLKEIMSKLGYSERNIGLREERNEEMKHLNIYSTSLVKEIGDLDIKHSIHDNIFMDTEVLRGFLSGLFDGDGGISGKTITLVFGTHYDFEPMCLDIQKALLFFGIRSRYRKYSDRFVIQIKTNDNQRFLDIIGFINDKKQEKGKMLECKTDEHIFGPTLLVESVEITEDYIDMYDVCNTDDGYFVADGMITHNTAADIYKLAVVQMFKRIVAEGWLGKVLFCGFIHDELLMEVHESINPYYFTKAWREEFEVKIQGYCRLFAGLGFGFCWYDAKGLDLPPLYIDEIEKVYEEDMEWDEDLESFLEDIKNNYELHKTNRIKKYILSEENKGEAIKPAIGSLLSEEIDKLIPKIQRMGNVDSYNAILTKSEIPLEGKGSVSYLQDQLKIFCKYYGIDYNSIDVKSPDEIVIQTEESTNTDNDFEDFYSDEVSPEVKKSMIELTLRMNGIYTDIEEKTVYMLEMWCYQNSQFQQATKILIDKGLITTDGDFKIIYYPTLNTANPQCAEIPNYFIPKDNISIIAQYYAVWRQQGIGVFK